MTNQSSVRWWDWRAAALLLIGLLAVASRLAATDWTAHLQISFVITFLGLAAGLALGQSRFGLGRVLFYAAVFGLFVVGWQIGLTLDLKVTWAERLYQLGARLTFAATQFAKQEPVQDPLLALLLFAVLFWIMSLQAGYALTRHADPWQATLPGGLALLIIHTYDFRPAGTQFTTLLWAASIYFLTSLLLLARLSYLKRRQGWQARRVYFSPEVDTDILLATVVATVVLVVLSWAAPLTPNVLPPARDMWAVVSQPFNTVRSRFSNLFTSLKASFGVVQDNYSNSLTLGRGNALDDTPILEVDAPTPSAVGPRYYWQAWVYDTYENGQWRNTFTEVDPLLPDTFDLTVNQYAGRVISEINITPQVAIGTLYTPAMPLWVSRPVNVTLAKDADGQSDVASMQAAVTLYPGETYKVRSSLSVATITDLRTAGLNYPQDIIDHYLKPTGVDRRVADLAKEIAAPYETPYDKADAITNWLRANITYADSVPATPPGRDPLEWFLFDIKQGFCNYYATSEVVMLRSLGIPARLAVGYARGEASFTETDAPSGNNRPGGFSEGLPARLTYTVRQRDAHAWPQVYFPKYGWVEFEPTVSQDPIIRPLGGAFDTSSSQNQPTPVPTQVNPLDDPSLQNQPDQPTTEAPNPISWPLVIGLAVIAIVVGLIVVGWQVRRRFNFPPLAIMAERGFRRMGLTPPKVVQNWARRAALSPVEKAYQEINDALRRLHVPPTPSATPTDRVALLKNILPEASAWASAILTQYQLAAYSTQAADAVAASHAGNSIRDLSWRRMLFLRLNGGFSNDKQPQRYTDWRNN